MSRGDPCRRDGNRGPLSPALLDLLWAIVDVNQYMGWIITSEFGPLQFAFVLLPAFVFLEKDGKLSKYNLPFSVGGTIAIWIFLTFLR